MPKTELLADNPNASEASEGLGLKKPQGTDFDYFSETCYDGFGDQGGIDNTRPKEILDEKESRALLKFAAEKGDAQSTRIAAERIKAELPNVFEMFKESSQPEVPQWADRTTGREVSPIDWIRLHYGKKCDDGTWIPNGLTRSDLLPDKPLYLAFAQWLKRHPEDDFDPAARRTLKRYTDPAEAVERLRAQKRASAARLEQ